MKNTILILISLLFLTGCEKEVTSLQDRGGVKYEINSDVGFTGKYVEKYENGQKKVEEHLKLGKRHGLYLSGMRMDRRGLKETIRMENQKDYISVGIHTDRRVLK